MNITQRTITLLAVLLIFLAIAYPPWINRVISPHGHVVRENYIGLHSVWHDFSQEASYPRLDVSRLLLEISAILLFGLGILLAATSFPPNRSSRIKLLSIGMLCIAFAGSSGVITFLFASKHFQEQMKQEMRAAVAAQVASCPPSAATAKDTNEGWEIINEEPTPPKKK